MENGAPGLGRAVFGEGNRSVLHGDLQISKGDGNHLCGVDEQPIAVGINGLE